MGKNVAIDGPSGAGKSTIAREIARQLGFIYVDTGALYRSIGLYAFERGRDLQNPEEVVPLLPEIRLELRFLEGVQHVFLNGRDVSEEIRRPEISMAASAVSAIPAVREFLFDVQHRLARENDVIMDGRDIGTVVLPLADVKIFLTASPEDRARRRCSELLAKGMEVHYDEVLKDIVQRDYNDSHREAAPLKQVPDAILVDTTGFEKEQSIQRLKSIIVEKLGGRSSCTQS